MRYRVKLSKGEEFLGLGYAEVQEDWIRLKFEEEDVQFMSKKVPEEVFFSRIYIDGLLKGLACGESHFEIPQYFITLEISKI